MPRALKILVIGMFMNVTGASFLWPLNTIYIHNHLGKSLTVAGLVLMLNSGASVVGNLCGGVLFDKIGGYKTIMLGIVITLVSLLGLIFFHQWPYYIWLLTIVGFGSGVVFPASYAMAGSIWPEGGRKAFNAIYVAQNAGVAVGSALGGAVAAFSFTYVFMANAMLYAVFFFIVYFGFRNIQSKQAAQTSILDFEPVSSRASFTALMILSSGYVLGWVAYSQWSTTIASHTQSIGMSLSLYSVLWTVNGILIVLGQPLVGFLVKKWAESLKAQMVIGFVIFIMSYGILLAAKQFHMFLAAMIILTIGEMLVWPAVPTIANKLAPKGKEGFYQGFVNSAATGGRMIGPLFGGVLVDKYGIHVLVIALMVLLLASIVTTVIYDRRLPSSDDGNQTRTISS
ncbi:MFS transporter [Bacillus atrophaeus]|uniref:Efflux transporter n=1 Tax=Bacillus atrophaeus (strain 1942) TaxID=720555 RepID=A0ABN3ZH29_BACA1|nr:MFS transporter [Bacillus atrophaeus]AMR61742.1 multidrug MFS transporter [Bacillus subtilis subsp. globigii]ADP33516.1 putative efflux transporter [Bacillus atrophaeus 1942]AIK46970.1 major Facilitator Superfamily protein [Bacillus atrophaeus subsp. globigii]ARW07957.1 putative MFS-type transporter YttB [Bacillus atrophaeus]EIM12642.1 putative efflux transporter [Bacillus atrophaeus C89]